MRLLTFHIDHMPVCTNVAATTGQQPLLPDYCCRAAAAAAADVLPCLRLSYMAVVNNSS